MYMTWSQASPCAKMASPRAYWTMVFATPAESRNVCALNAGTFIAPLKRFARLKGFLDSIHEAWHTAGVGICAQRNRPRATAQRAGARDASGVEHAGVGGRQLQDLPELLLDKIRQAVDGFGE